MEEHFLRKILPSRSYFLHERFDGSSHESFNEIHPERASRLRMLPSNLPFKLLRLLAEMGPDLISAETSMVAASINASREAVVIVAHPHRHS